ncbi:uncharacterized protein [Physcomitrium patens]|uniref:O-fucosyltransferase family protein n=1 Tax=Physcomitrium patens TaxID=3218 RepID=A0A2K1J1Z8_PHYPA|nr:uncharacterized protein LOC112295525 [Physcomitrium patens]PNR35550.1 hypothetical protein PHYPA_023450 [Physcomitrium patens]|eukprot:XP_024403021.1 uncharacterized protein LOC112295525 [Physcomitrella patens]
MAKSWRCLDSLPDHMKVVLGVFSVVTMVSLLTLSLLWEDQFGFSSLVFNVVGYGKDPSLSTYSRPVAIFVMDDDDAKPPSNPPADFPPSENISNRFSDGPSPAAAPSPAPEAQPPGSEFDENEKFFSPLLTASVGAGNQLMEYMSAAVMARATNRTLCLPPFFSGPAKHSGILVRARGGLAWEDRYNVLSLARFTKVASLEQCLQQCNYTLDSNVFLKETHEPLIRGFKYYKFANESLNLHWSHVKWQSTNDINTALGNLEDKCVGLSGLFPGLRWRGAFLSVSAFLQPSPRIFEVVNILQNHAIGKGVPYLAVHWRFEESSCPRHQIGLCFSRCKDGSIIDTNFHPFAKEWVKMSEDECNTAGHFRGVGLSKLDIIATIEQRAANHSINTVYLATDGWTRGPEGLALIKESILLLRKGGLNVIGLWSIPGLPNFADGTYYDPYVTMGRKHVINGQQIALVEQEICVRSNVFLGSGQSTWSLAVFRMRLAKRQAAEILGKVWNAESMDLKARDALVSETLLQDRHAAGLQCHYSRWMNVSNVNDTVETYADEFPDGWLDLDACEGRIGNGGRCQVAKCY